MNCDARPQQQTLVLYLELDHNFVMSSRNVESLSTIISIAPKSSLEELVLRTAICNCICLFSHRLKKMTFVGIFYEAVLLEP